MGLAKRWAEELDSRGFGDTGDQAVCLECVLDESLREQLRPHISKPRCTFCAASSPAADFEQLMYIVIDAVRFLFTTAESGLPWDSEDHEYIGGPTLDSQEVAEMACSGDVTDDVLVAIGEAITEQQWVESDFASARPDQVLGWAWDAFCDKVKHESRFVFLSATEESSDHPDDMTTADLLRKLEEIILDNEMLVRVPSGRKFWRGRLADRTKIAEYSNASALGSPPRDRASNSRMSPAGISMFYGSDDIDTVVAEIGAHSTVPYAIVGAFTTVRDLTLLDLADLPALPSLYHDTGRTTRFFDLAFVRAFARDLGKPIMLDGREHIEYVPTQVVTEYLRFVMPDQLDGILFRSAQNGGINCVIFCDSAGCVDRDGQPRGPLAFQEPYLMIERQSVRCVRIVSAIAASDPM